MAKRQPCPKSGSFQPKPSGSRLGQQSQGAASKAPAGSKQEIVIPAFSIPPPPKKTANEFEKLRKKTVRRNAPPGEDLKEIQKIIKSLKGQDITVQEFIRLIGPSTGDNGDALKSVMNDDLAQFRKLAKKVYETVTQDNSDVLLNQQTEVSEYYKEKKEILNQRMMNALEEIYAMAIDFDFERYCKEKDKYLLELFPIPEEMKVEPEEMEMMKRQEAFHRLQWLKSEGERLNEENNRLKKRLREMKRLQAEELKQAMTREQQAEDEREALEQAEADKQETLEKLSESFEKTIIAKEMSLRLEKDRDVYEPRGRPSKEQTKKAAMKKKRRPPWNETTASEMNEQSLQDCYDSEVNKAKTAPAHQIRTPSPRTIESPVNKRKMKNYGSGK